MRKFDSFSLDVLRKMRLSNDVLEEISVWLDLPSAHRLMCASRALRARWKLSSFWQRRTERLVGVGFWSEEADKPPENLFRELYASHLEGEERRAREKIEKQIEDYRTTIRALQQTVDDLTTELHAREQASTLSLAQLRRPSGRTMRWRQRFRRPTPEFKVFGILRTNFDGSPYPNSGTYRFSGQMATWLDYFLSSYKPLVRCLVFAEYLGVSRTLYIWQRKHDTLVAIAPRIGLIPPPFREYMTQCWPDASDKDGLYKLQIAFEIPFDLQFDEERPCYALLPELDAA